MPTAYDCFQCYVALRVHFTQWDYNYFTYKGKTHLNQNSFHTRADAPCFQHLVDKYKKPFDVLLAHQADNPKKHISRIIEDRDHYIEYQKRMQSLSYMFSQEIKQLDPILVNNFTVEPGKHPLLMRAYLARKVSLETGTILFDLFNNSWKNESKGDILFNDVALRMMKYHHFIRYNREKFHKIALDHFRIDAKYILESV